MDHLQYMATIIINNINLPKLLLYATLLLLCSTISNGESKAPLFVFGDSVFDSGMTLYDGVERTGAKFWPYGETFFKKPAGRYCDGRVIPDFIANFAGLPLNRPYLLPGVQNFSEGISFASAGACVLVETRPDMINLARQIRYFVDMVKKLKREVGDSEASKLLSKAVYLFNIGGNDYFSLLQQNMPNLPLSSTTKKDFINLILGNMTHHIHTIYNQGGRKFAFLNMGPLGCMPSMKVMLGFIEGGCAQEPQELAHMHNIEFAALARRLTVDLPGFTYTIYDFHTSVIVRVFYGRKFGFKESETACCGTGPYNGGLTCQKVDETFSLCSVPSEYLWYDSGHTTEKANKQFAKEMWSGGRNVIAPYNLRTLFSMEAY